MQSDYQTTRYTPVKGQTKLSKTTLPFFSFYPVKKPPMVNLLIGKLLSIGLITVLSVSIMGCGDDDDESFTVESPNPVVNPNATVVSDTQLIDTPIITKTFSRSELSTALQESGLESAVLETPVCGITVRYMNHTTTGLAGEATNATGAVITPTGDDAQCQADRPITLYAHGTTPQKSYNLAALDDPENPAYITALYMAATFAGQGDIVIAPNYPGYDISTLDYAPYVTRQQGTQMLDGFEAGKQVLAQIANKKSFATNATMGDKLFITGYSQGGYVALATAEALDNLGVTVTAVSPGSGPYAVNAFADSIMSGRPIFGGTVFLPMLTSSYHAEYNDQYPNVADNVFSETYQNAADLFPTNDNIYSLFFGNKIPITGLFETAPTGYPALANISPPSPQYAFGFDDTRYLFDTDFRAKYVQDMTANPDGIYPTLTGTTDLPQSDLPIRGLFIKNDLRGYMPTAPVLMCGGNQDPSVTFDVGAQAQALIWQNNPSVNFAMIDVDISNQSTRTEPEQAAYISSLPSALDSEVRLIADEVQARFTEDLQTRLGNEYQIAFATAIEQGKTEAQAVIAGNTARTSSLLSSYHGMVAPYCNQVAHAFFDEYR